MRQPVQYATRGALAVHWGVGGGVDGLVTTRQGDYASAWGSQLKAVHGVWKLHGSLSVYLEMALTGESY